MKMIISLPPLNIKFQWRKCQRYSCDRDLYYKLKNEKWEYFGFICRRGKWTQIHWDDFLHHGESYDTPKKAKKSLQEICLEEIIKNSLEVKYE